MSASLDGNASATHLEGENPVSTHAGDVKRPKQARQHATPSNYKGFVAGVFSGIAKLSVGHPFDTIKVRMQTSQHAQFSGPLDCLLKTVRNEGFVGVYKGATPPLIGWMFMDSLYDLIIPLSKGVMKLRVP